MDVAAGVDRALIPGDALVTLPDVLSELPRGEPAVVMHSFVLNQFSSDQRERLYAVIEEGRRMRPILRVGLEWLDLSTASSEILVDDGGGARVVGAAHHHGEWIDLYARP